MTRKRIIPGAEFIDGMRKHLTRLELELADPYADRMIISLALTSLENQRAFLEGAICNAISDRGTVDVSQL